MDKHFEHGQSARYVRRLMCTLVETLLAEGMTSMFLWVLGDNPSRAFYEKMGGQYVAEKTITIGDTELVEVTYGWDDIRSISLN